jgi:hypothetical protein
MSKPRIYNGTEWLEFETQAEYDAWIASHSPMPDMTDVILDERKELIGKAAMRSIIKAIRGLSATSSDKITLMKLLTTVLMLLGDGAIQDARDMANAEPTTTVFTASRKSFVISEIDKALAQI